MQWRRGVGRAGLLRRAIARRVQQRRAIGGVLRERVVAMLRSDRYRVCDAGALRKPDRSGSALDVASNDYLGLTHVPRETWSGAGASRLVFGTKPAHRRLEAAVARWLGTECAVLFSSGYAANLAVVGALALPEDHVVADALNHASLIDGVRLSGAARTVCPHLSVEAVDEALRVPSSGAKWVVTESYFSMDGDVPELAALAGLTHRHHAGLIVDEAHALGVFGPQGRGLCAEAGIRPTALVGTFGKAFGLQGAFVAGSADLIRLIWNRGRSFVYSTAPSPTLCAAVEARLGQVRAAEASRRRLEGLGAALRSALAAGGAQVVAGRGPIVPVVLGHERRALACAAWLAQQGIRAVAIRPPTVPEGAARIRLTVKATFTWDDIQRVADAVLGFSAAMSAAGEQL